MGEFLLELLSPLFEILLEAVLEFLAGLVLDIAQRMLERFISPVYVNTVIAFSAYFLLGIAAGFVSLFYFPNRVVHHSYIHGSSLLLSPLLVGSGMALLGSDLRRRDKLTIRLETFTCGFAFALGMALIRFFYIK